MCSDLDNRNDCNCIKQQINNNTNINNIHK